MNNTELNEGRAYHRKRIREARTDEMMVTFINLYAEWLDDKGIEYNATDLAYINADWVDCYGVKLWNGKADY